MLLDLLARGEHPRELGAGLRDASVAGLLVERHGLERVALDALAGAPRRRVVEAGRRDVELAGLLEQVGGLLGVARDALAALVEARELVAVGADLGVARLLERHRFGDGSLGLLGQQHEDRQDVHQIASLRGPGRVY